MTTAVAEVSAARPAAIRRRISHDNKLLAASAAIIIAYLLISLALPLATILAKSLHAYDFRLDWIEIEFKSDSGWERRATAEEWAAKLSGPINSGIRPSERTRLPLAELLPKNARRGVEKFRLRDLSPQKGLILLGGELSKDGEWIEIARRDLRRVLLRPTQEWSAVNYAEYFSTPALRSSIVNSLFVSILTALIVVPLSFFYALAMARARIRFKPFFRLVALAPILVPSLLPGLGLVYLFGNQGAIRELLGGYSIYGPIGIVIASVFFTFPHAFIIQLTSLSLADRRLYEAAESLGSSRWRIFRTVTVPGARYGIVSASFVAFTLTITDFGVPKVIGGQFNVLAVDIYKQVIGQQNFQLGAVVSMLLLIPAVAAFAVERAVARRQVAQLSAGAVPYSPGAIRADFGHFLICALTAFFIVGILAMCQAAALFKFWPYDLSLSLANYDFNRTDGGGWAAYRNSIKMAAGVGVFGTIVVFVGAYLCEKAPRLGAGRSALQFMAMMPMAVPGMVLGLSYIFFFNAPQNPLHFLYGSMAILIICTLTHFYTVSHLTAATALKQVDSEFEAVSASLRQPVYRVFWRITVPVCLPAILDISVYLFVNAMTTVSAVVFLYSPDTTLASVAVLNMDDAGDIAPAAAMGMMIFYTNVAVRIAHAAGTRRLRARTQAWRTETN